MKEIFKNITGYETRYQISNLGNVKSLRKNLVLRPQINSCKYIVVSLWKEGDNKKTHSVHHLVWDAFGDSPRNGRKLQVDHIDNNKHNNRVDNLQLLTNRENSIKYFKSVKHTRTSKYLGVTKFRNLWVSQMSVGKKHITLGHFKTEKEASEVYEKAVEKIYSEKT